jgi:hypothetical protein
MTDDERTLPLPPNVPRRRLILGGAGGLTLAAATVALSGCVSVADGNARKQRPGDDAALLANLLGLEDDAVAAYDTVLAAAWLGEAERGLAAGFLADHQNHVDTLRRAVERAGGTVVNHDRKSGQPAAPALAGRDDAVRFLVGVEQGLALAHLAAVPAFAGRDLAKGAAGILSVESMHWAMWRRAVGEEPVPAPIIG